MKNHTQNPENKRMIKRVFVLMAAVFTAIAVAVVCALTLDFSPTVDVDGVGAGETTQSATYTNKTGNLTGAGVINNGDVLNYNYTGGVVSVTLPKGIYTLTVYGGQGGNAQDYTGGKGGMSTGRYEITASSQTLYIAVGGQGGTTKNSTSAYASGGWNGGGRGYPSGGNTSHTQTSGGGGGATHIATGSNRGVLANYANYKSEILIVAGGGGGAGAWYGNRQECSNGGAGGGTSGGTATNGVGRSAAGGTQNSGYAFGQGGTGVHADQGGGGGGWWGGKAQTVRGDDAYISGGGGGSGYLNTGRLMTSPAPTTSQGSRSGTGYATITVVNVNKAPTTKNITKSMGVRGTASVVINAGDIASDPEGTNVYFTDGTASNLDTFTTTRNTALFVDSACSKLATDYFDWEWTSNTQLKITNIKRFPRSGIDGSTANGSIKLYARVRDNYGNNTQRGWAVISFTATVGVTNVSQKYTTPTKITAGVGNGYSYFLGNSNTAVAPETDISENTVYNPSHVNGAPRYTAILGNSLRKNTTFTIKASDLVGGVYSGDTVAIALNSTTAITGGSKKYRIKEYDDNTNKVTAYNVNRVAIANAFDQLSFECLVPEPGYQVFSVTLYVLEKSTAYGTANVVPGCRTIALDIVFKMDNTRPVLKDASLRAPVVTVDALKSATVDLNDFFKDADTQLITSATHQIRSIKVPTHEFVQLDKYGQIVSTVNVAENADESVKNRSYFNLAPGNAAISAADALAGSLTSGMFAGADFSTGFEEWYISSGASDKAFVQYSINNNNNNRLTITFSGLRATYDMYKAGRNAVDTRIVTSGDSSALKTNENGAHGGLNAGHFYILVNVLDKNDTSDEGIWLPIGIKVNNDAPTNLSRERGAAGAGEMPSASGNPGDVFYFTPMGITIDKVTYPVGARKDEHGNLISNDISPLASDADNFFVGNMLNGSSIGQGGDHGVLNELLTIVSTPSDVQSNVSNNTDGTFFSVAEEPIYIPKAYFGGRVKYDSSVGTTETLKGVEYVIVRGLKITLNNWTHNRYLYAEVNIKDSAGAPAENVCIAVNVSNAAPKSFERETETGENNQFVKRNVAKLGYEANGMKVSSSYTPAGENGMATITYNIPMHTSVIVTPNDLLTDGNMTAAYPTGGFTLNGLSGLFDDSTGLFTVNGVRTENDVRKTVTGLGGEYNYSQKDNLVNYGSEAYVRELKSTLTTLQNKRDFAGKLSSGKLFTSALEQTKSAYIDRLFFERKDDGAALDGYKFDPYATRASANNFAVPSITGESFISYKYGSSLQFNGESDVYNIDYMIITAESRTQAGAPVEIVLNVRDRMGSGASGIASGVTSIKVVINVVNSSPRVQHPNKIYTLKTDPVGDATYDVTDSSGVINVVPSTMIINAYSYTEEGDRYRNFLIDNEGDRVMFHTGDPVTVVDGDGHTTDDGTENGNRYLGKYINVTLSSTQMIITALNSTQNIPKLYVEFTVTDGRYYGNELETFRCRIQVEVLNSKLDANHGEDGFTAAKYGDGNDADLNVWTVETLDTTDITKTRYFASSEAAVKALANDGTYNVPSDQIRRIVNDKDGLQGAVLSHVDSLAQSNPDANRKYYTIDRTKDPSTFKSGVPYISTANHDGTPVGVYIDLIKSGDSTLESYFATPDVGKYMDILYIVDGNIYKASDLRDPTNTVVQTDPDKFFDSEGRWIVRDWAVYVTPNKATPIDEYLQLNFMLSDDARYGGGTFYKNTAYEKNNATTVDGYKLMRFQLSISSLGIVPYSYYDQFGGYYTVRDGADSKISYISTYDGKENSLYPVDQGQNTLYLDGNGISTSTGTELKKRDANTEDGTNAGIHSGSVYSAAGPFEYDMRYSDGTVQTVTGGEKAFKYSDTIVVSGSKNAVTGIPMSYFGLRKGMVLPDSENGGVTYPESEYVAYNLDGGYGRAGMQDVARAISISDGVNTWTGWSEENRDPSCLLNNPYVNISLFDAYVAGKLNTSDPSYIAAIGGDYSNKALAVTTVDSNGNSNGYFKTDSGQLTAQSKENAKNLVGNNGHVMYLADQTTKLQENMFGITLSKKDTRSSAASLTISIDIAECRYSDGKTEVADPDTAVTVTFKLEIGNSPITLEGVQGENGVRVDENKGYYTDVELKTTDSAFNIGLARTGVTASGNLNRVIRFTDEDAVVNADRTINETKSDKAYFYSDSTRKLGVWGGGKDYYDRALEYTADGNTVVFDNTSSDANAQKSMRNYFGARSTSNFAFSPATANSQDVGYIGNVNSEFQANGGKYGSNMLRDGTEGYSRYFNITVSSDGSMLSITPLAKTTLNKSMYGSLSAQAKTQYFNERGLEYDANKDNGAGKEKGKGYYPLKIMIYDSHGDGFMFGSYVALEIRVYIDGAAPTLSANLEDDKSLSARAGDKKIDVALPVGQSYQYSVSDVIRSNSLLRNEDSGDIFWEGDYVAMQKKPSEQRTAEEWFKLDTGTYLKSPFNDVNYGWRKTSNAELRAGTAKLSDTYRNNDGVYNVPIENQPDVVMSMEYEGGRAEGDKTVLSNQSNPRGNAVTVTVNRRSTYESKQYKNFTFKIVFTDSDDNKTSTLSVNVEVTNQAPTVRSQAIENAKNLRMRVGDSFTIVTTPYDKFTGVADGNSVSAQASASYKTITSNQSSIVDRNLLKISGDAGYRTSVRYNELTTSNIDGVDKYKLHSFDRSIVTSQHLGYLAVADDDTPWTLRILDIRYYDNTCFNIAQKYDQLPLEGQSGTTYALDTVIVANRVCENMPITVTVIDEENATVTFTIYVTVESSMPNPIADGDRIHNRHEALRTTYDRDGDEQIGVYEMYMTAFSDTTAHLRDVRVNDPSEESGFDIIPHVYGEATFNVNQIAYDPDYTDNGAIALYSEGLDYDVFMFNDMPMSRSESDRYLYYNDLFTVKTTSDFRSFTITCNTYNPYSDWDELEFYIRDVGNNVFSNAVPITLRICTLNSAMTNEHQSATGKVTNGIINNNTVDTIYVKPYDDYVGASADVKDLPEDQKNLIIDVPGTYQMFNYKNVEQSIDQPDTTGWGINDLDVANSTYNLNYGIRVYALMEPREDNRRVYDSLSVNRASALFFETPSAASSMMQNHYWYMKDENAMSDYFVAGMRAGGGMISGANNSLNMFLQQYFLFDIGNDGVSLTFRPVTCNIDTDILFYVEFDKDISYRSITRAGASSKAGTLFYVKVKDSAPTANTENEQILEFSGKLNESAVFTVFDSENSYGSLFNDSDAGDSVRINAFASNATAEEDYKTALAEADCDWQARNGVKRAIDISVNNGDEAVNGVPAHSIKVAIVRRIDAKDEDGNYLTEVTLPIVFTGTDKSGRSVSTKIYVTVQNSDAEFNEDKLANEPRDFDDFGAGYEFSKDEESGMYVFDAYVAPDSDELTMNLVLDEWIKDPDFTSMSADTDSFKLAKSLDVVNAGKYMYNDSLQICPDGSSDPIAVITPIFGNNNTNVDFNHFAGFKIKASSYERGVTGVAYMRIIDRSADERTTDGIVIMVKVTVLNAAPNVKAGMDKKQFTIIGSDSKASDPFEIDITQFVEDRNNDSVRVFGIAPLPATNVHCSAEEENGGNILRVSAAGDENVPQKCLISARKGFYGTQSVLITVADGDLATDLSARTVMFTVTFTVVYDFSQVNELNTLSAVRCLPFKVTPEKLFKEIKDTFDKSYVSSGNDGGRNVLMSAEEEPVFNPGSDYYIENLVQNDANVTVNRDEDGDWQFVCTREVDRISFNVTFKRKVDANDPNAQTFQRTFNAHVGKNSSPVLLEQIRRNGELMFHTRDGQDYSLDSNGSVTITTDMLFNDIDKDNGDRLVFDPAVTEVVSGTMCSVRVSEDGLMLYLTFNTRGETDLTVGIKDRTGETVKVTFKIKNIDRPSPSFMENIKISYESHPYIWLGAAIGVLVLILFIILLVILLKRRKRKQEELEAILVSEMELEEQMMRLAGGTGSAPYQSFGYLPPTMPTQNDPGLMIGGGSNAPQNDVIGLNPGQEGDGGNSDM